MNQANGHYIGKLIARFISGTITPEQCEELIEWCSISESNESLFLRMISPDYIHEAIERYKINTDAMESGWERIIARTTGRKRFLKMRLIGYVAMAVTLTGLGIWRIGGGGVACDAEQAIQEVKKFCDNPLLILPNGLQLELDDNLQTDKCDSILLYAYQAADAPGGNPEAMSYHTLRIPLGRTYDFILPDGTSVTLNAGSELTFPAKFAHHERRVFLKSGQAYFNVEYDSDHPFFVEAAEVEIRVYGTRFAVRAYSEEEVVKTVLEHGEVSMSVNGREMRLLPDTQGSFNRIDGTLEISPVDVTHETAWLHDRLSFDNTALRDIIRDLSRLYDFRFRFGDDVAQHIHFSMKLKQNGTFSDILNLIRETGKINFDVDKEVIVISATEN